MPVNIPYPNEKLIKRHPVEKIKIITKPGKYMKLISERRLSLPLIRFAFFFVIFYLYVCFFIDPRLIYHGYGIIPTPVPAFYWGTGFINRFLTYPGGLTEYISALLSQFYYFQHIGSLVITVVAMLICIATGKYVTAIGNTRFRAILFIPALFIVMIYDQYFHCLDISLGLLITLFFLLIYLLTTRFSAIFRLVVFFVSSVSLFYVAGGCIILYAILCGIFEIVNMRKPVFGFLYLLSMLLIPYAAAIYIFDISNIDAYARITPFHPKIYAGNAVEALGLYLFFPLAALWFPLWRPFASILQRLTIVRILSIPVTEIIPYGTKLSKYFRINKYRFFYESLVLFVIAASVVLFRFEANRKIILRINYFWSQEMWHQILMEERRMPIENYPFFINHDVNKALFYTGRLPYDMFSYPQKPEALLSLNFFDPEKGGSKYGKNYDNYADLPRLCDAFFRLGLMNNAEHLAYEVMESIGEYPAILRQLFFINVVKGNTETARIFLNVLSRDLFFGKWAKSYLRKLDEDPLLSTDKLVQNLRSIKIGVDRVGTFSVEETLQDLINKNKNRMAFEYLMAYYLLSFQTEKIVQSIRYLDDFNYSDIPRLYEEAIIIYINTTGESVNLYGRGLSEDAVQRFMKFHDIFNSYKGNPKEAFNALAKDFGTSYFFYHIFGRSGVKK